MATDDDTVEELIREYGERAEAHAAKASVELMRKDVLPSTGLASAHALTSLALLACAMAKAAVHGDG